MNIHPRAKAVLDAVERWATAFPGDGDADRAMENIHSAAKGWRNTGFPIVETDDVRPVTPPVGDDHVRLLALESFVGSNLMARLAEVEEKVAILDAQASYKDERDVERFEAVEERINRVALGLAELTVAVNELREAAGLAPVQGGLPYIDMDQDHARLTAKVETPPATTTSEDDDIPF